MKKFKKLMSGVLCFVIMVSGFGFKPTMANISETEIYDMKVNDIERPVGIDVNPKFSWKLSSDVIGQKQTAYRITVKNGDSTVWDSGKVQSDNTVAVEYCGNTLLSSTEYDWQLTVWDKNGDTATAFSTFETGLLEKDAWDDTEWISVDDGVKDSSGNDLDYTIEAELYITKHGNNNNACVFFNKTDDYNFFMWQIKYTPSDGVVKLRPHVKRGGSYTVIATSELTSYAKNISDIYNTPQSLKIHVTKSGIITYFNGVRVSEFSSSELDIAINDVIGQFGLRAHGDTTVCDSFKVTDASKDKVIIDTDFSDGTEYFAGASVSSGKATLSSTSGGELLAALTDAVHYDRFNNVNYSVSADITVSSQAIGIIFGASDNKNGYMWQLYKNSDMTVSVKPHSLVNGKYGAFSDYIDVVDVNDIENTYAKIRIDVTHNSFSTYVNGTLINTVPVGIKNAKGDIGIAPILGNIGIRACANEKGSIDNITVTDFTSSTSGNTVYSIDFDNGVNPFLSGEIVNGALYMDNINEAFLYDSASHFYKKFETKKPISAKLYTTGSGIYNVFINGSRVGDDELKPGFTEALTRRFYHSFDVTELITDGNNIISAISTGGWWTDAIVVNVGKKTAFRAKLILTYSDGSTKIIGTDTSWQADHDSPVVYADIYTGEVYDATVTPSYTGKNATINTEFDGIIEAYKGSRLRIRDDLQKNVVSATVYQGAVGSSDTQYGKINTVAVYTDGNFTLKKGQSAVIDFGQNLAGWESLVMSGKRSTTVTVRHAEALNDCDGLISRGNDGPEGSIYTANLRSAKALTKYTLSGEGDEHYHPSYTYFGFRYIEITATDDITFKGIHADVLTSVESTSGAVTTSDEDINQLISNSLWGMYSNYVSVPTDCPQRDERAGWAGDTQVYANTALYFSNSTKPFLEKWLKDLRDNQLPDGQYAGAAPTCKNGRNYGALGWADAGIIVPYNIYKMYGDTDIIKEHYESMQLYVDGFLATTDKKGAKHTYGDWLSIEENAGDVKRILGVAYYAWDALMMSEMANAIGKSEDAERYYSLYLTEKEYFIQQFVLDDGNLCDSRQSSLLFALFVDLLPNEQSVQKVTKQLVDNIEAAGGRLQTGFLGTSILLPALTKAGCADIAYRLLLQHDYPSWLYTVDNGATTMWERWNTYTTDDGFGEVSMNSFNHYAYGAVVEWMFSDMAGIKPTVGFNEFVLSPTPDKSLGYVKAEYDSANGLIKSSWEYTGDVLTYEATVPANTTATVKLPVEDITSVYVNGKEYSKATLDNDGIVFVGYKDGIAEFKAVASTFTVSVGNKADHKFENYVSDNNATCKSNCTETAKCKWCDETDTREIADSKADHKFENYVSDKNATCCEDGTKTAKCKWCDLTDTITDKGTALGHKETEKIFKDVVKDKWYNDAIDYAYTHGFISGMSATEFGVSTPVTRGMFITILARIAGVDTTKNNVSTKFTDVANGKYYTAAIKWASENGIVNGMSETTFEPNSAIQRQQLCVMIVNFAKFMKIDLEKAEEEIAFSDASTIAKWAKDAVKTCQMADIVNGYANGAKFEFRPKNTATRAEAAQILYKFHSEFIAK